MPRHTRLVPEVVSAEAFDHGQRSRESPRAGSFFGWPSFAEKESQGQGQSSIMWLSVLVCALPKFINKYRT